MNRWEEIWNKREAHVQEKIGLEDLVRLDGFDTGAGAIAVEEWRAYVERRAKEMGLAARKSVLEIGCGAGAFSFPLSEQGCVVSGVDYSTPLIRAAQHAMPKGTWRVAAADEATLPEKSLDAVLANSVFHYFPHEEYARLVLARMVAAARESVGIFDVPDARSAAEAEAHRRAALGEAEYTKRYEGLSHLSFAPEWFVDQAPAGWHVTISPQDIEGYGNNQYRFNVVMEYYG